MTEQAQPSDGPLRVERLTGDRAGVVVLTLNLPDRRNAMTAELTAAWESAVAELARDADVRVVVVTGAGSAFCAGGDVGWIGADPGASVAALRARMMPFYRAWLSIRELEVPTIAAVHGPAVGAGLCLALACDLRYAAPEARLSAPFTTLGMHAGMAATWLLPEAVGVPAARELLFTGRVVLGEEAADLGLVNRVLPADGFLDAVLDIAAGIASTAPVATRLTKVALARGGHATFDAALQWEGLAQPITLATADLQEGLAAAKERRKPNFRGD
jgi:enoyl-CoA hydratase/carnithine racemase